MRASVLIGGALVLAMAAPAAAQQALLGATLFDGTGAVPVADAAVIVDEGTIACAGTRTECPVPDGAQVHDLSGRYITPGLVDAHVHFAQTGWLDGRPDGLRDRATLREARR